MSSAPAEPASAVAEQKSTEDEEEEEYEVLSPPQKAANMARVVASTTTDAMTDLVATPKRVIKTMFGALRTRLSGATSSSAAAPTSSAPSPLATSPSSSFHLPFGHQKKKQPAQPPTVEEPQRFVVLGHDFPNLEAKSTHGLFKLYEYLGSGWGLLLTHPAAFEPVGLTELAAAVHLLNEFERRSCKLCSVSTDTLAAHFEWTTDLLSFTTSDTTSASAAATSSASAVNQMFSFPILTDAKHAIAHQLGVLDAKAEDSAGAPVMCRAAFIIGPDRKLRFAEQYPATCGRNIAELLRVVDALQRTENRVTSTPSGWVPGRPLLVNADANLHVKDLLFPLGVMEHPLPHSHLNSTPDPHTEDRTLLHYLAAPKPALHTVSMLNLGDEAPNFGMHLEDHLHEQQEEDMESKFTDVGEDSSLLQYVGRSGGWGIICPLADPPSPACLTEVAGALRRTGEFARRQCKIIFLTTQPLSKEWMEDAMEFARVTQEQLDEAMRSSSSSTGGGDQQGQTHPLPFAVVLDTEREITARLGALDEKIRNAQGYATIARAVFVVGGREGGGATSSGGRLTLRLSMRFPASVARNWDEVLRCVDSMQLTDATVSLSTPEGWRAGEECVADGSMPADQVESYFPPSMTRTVPLKSKRTYLSYVKDPTDMTSVE